MNFGNWSLGFRSPALGLILIPQSPIPIPQSPIPNPQSPFNVYKNYLFY